MTDPIDDSDLWVRARGYEGRLLLGSNPYTRPGRIRVSSPLLGRDIIISKNEIVDASPLSWAWIKGYLIGSGPRPSDLYPDEVSSRLQRWATSLKEFLETGEWTAGFWVDLPSTIPILEIDATPYAIRSNEVWRWTGESWIFESPQPLMDRTFRIGSECSRRGFHDDELLLLQDFWICETCGFLEVLG
jgi:hypothetical protein